MWETDAVGKLVLLAAPRPWWAIWRPRRRSVYLVEQVDWDPRQGMTVKLLDPIHLLNYDPVMTPPWA